MTNADPPGITPKELLQSAIDDLVDRAGKVASLAEREVGKARVAVEALARSSDPNAEGVAQAQGRVSEKRLAELFAVQAATIARFCEELCGFHAAQRGAASASSGFLREVASASGTVARSARTAEQIAREAEAAASAIGSAGTGALAIAERTLAVVSQIAGANARLDEAVGAVEARLRAVEEHIESSQREADALVVRTRDALDARLRAFGSFRNDVAWAEATGETRARRVRDEAARMLVHLERHDRIGGMLQAIRGMANSGSNVIGDDDVLEGKRLSEWCASLLSALDASAAHSLAEVSPMVEALSALNQGGREHVEALERLHGTLERQHSGDGLQHQLAALTAALHALLAQQRDALRGEREALEALRPPAAAMLRALADAKQIALESHVLGVAAKTESARLGDAGQRFEQVGERLLSLTKEVKTSLSGITSCARELDALIAAMATRVHGAEKNATEFAERLDRALKEEERASSEALGSASAALDASRRHARAMLDGSFAAIQHFQFQDRITQELRAMQLLVRTVAAVLSSDGKVIDPGTLAAIPRFAEAEAAGDDSLASGDALFF